MQIKEVSCGFLIASNGLFLLAHATNGATKKANKYDGRWGFPKGHVEPGESDISCAYRELHEEVGLDLRKYADDKNVTIFDSSPTYVYTNRGGSKQNKIFLVIDKSNRIMSELQFKCSTIVENENFPEIDCIEWVTWEEALSMTSHGVNQVFRLNINPLIKMV